MTLSFREWSCLVRIHPRGGNHAPPSSDEPQADGLMRLYLERALDQVVLTPAQRAIALRRLAGESVASIAASRGTKPGTVRSQFSQVLLKADAADYEEFSSAVWKRAFAA
jgi:DNA-binding NarL/FixJ family response regulator